VRVTAVLIIALCGCASAETLDDTLQYDLAFSAAFNATNPVAVATITLSQHRAIVKVLDFNAPSAKYSQAVGDGEVQVRNDRILWTPPAAGGTLSYRVQIDSVRGDAYDAKHDPDWILMRLGDLFPAAKARTLKGAQSNSSLVLHGPQSWSFESRYGSVKDKTKAVPASGRNFNRPTGWLVGGKLGTRRDNIGGRNVVVSAPVGHGLRRLDTMAFLRWTLPEVARVFPTLPRHLLIAGAPDAMWRGGLSAPGSLYLHKDRPLVSENGTSTLLHELIHLGNVHSAAQQADWIVEGIAEYYSLLILKRSGGISEKRFQQTIERLRSWVEKDGGRLAEPSKGVDTAAAVLTLHALAAELQIHGSHIDHLVTRLTRTDVISRTALVEITTQLLGHSSRVLDQALERP
jgi:hypothetical protein